MNEHAPLVLGLAASAIPIGVFAMRFADRRQYSHERSIQFRCAECHEDLYSLPVNAGHRIVCIHCGELVKVPVK